jgi:hypothetical protein
VKHRASSEWVGLLLFQPEARENRADHDYNREYRDEIAAALKQLTGRDFGTDKKQWMIWLDQQKEF